MKGSRPHLRLRYYVPAEEAPANMRPPEWPFKVGDLVQVDMLGEGQRQSWRRYSGRVVSITPEVMTINAGKYPISVARWAWWAGYTKVAKLA